MRSSPLYVERAMAFTLEEARKMQAAARTHPNLKVQVGHQFTLRIPPVIDDDSSYTFTIPDKSSNSLYKFTLLNKERTVMNFNPMLTTHAGNYTVTIVLKDNN